MKNDITDEMWLEAKEDKIRERYEDWLDSFSHDEYDEDEEDYDY